MWTVAAAAATYCALSLAHSCPGVRTVEVRARAAYTKITAPVCTSVRSKHGYCILIITCCMHVYVCTVGIRCCCFCCSFASILQCLCTTSNTCNVCAQLLIAYVVAQKKRPNREAIAHCASLLGASTRACIPARYTRVVVLLPAYCRPFATASEQARAYLTAAGMQYCLQFVSRLCDPLVCLRANLHFVRFPAAHICMHSSMHSVIDAFYNREANQILARKHIQHKLACKRLSLRRRRIWADVCLCAPCM